MLANRYYKKTTRLSARIDSRRRQKRKQKIQEKIAFVFLGIVILAAGVSIFFSWEKFRISRITFSGLERTNEEALRAYIQDRLRERFVILFPRDNIFFFGPQRLSQGIMSSFPSIQSASVIRAFSSGLRFDIVEYREWGLYCFGDPERCLWIDENAHAFRDIANEQIDSFPKIRDESASDTRIGNMVISPRRMEIARFFNEREEFGTIEMIISKNAETLRVKAQAGWEILIREDGDLENAYKNVHIALQGEIKERVKDLEYIDLRLGNKIFYKFRESGR